MTVVLVGSPKLREILESAVCGREPMVCPGDATPCYKGEFMAEFILSILATARAGSPERAESLLRQFEDQNRGVYISPFSRASYHLALGQTDEAFDYLEVTFAHRETFLTRTLTGPLFASIRSDPRYLTLLRRMNLA